MKQLLVYGVVCAISVASISLAAPPSGYDLEFEASPRSISGVYAVDSTGCLYYGHYTSGLSRDDQQVNRNKGMSNELWIFNPSTNTHELFYRATDHSTNPRVNSASGIAIDETTNPWRYYIADQSPNGDPWTSGAIWIARDLNDDGDVNDVGETELATGINDIPSIEGILFDNSLTILYASDAAGTTGSTMIHRLHDVNSDQFFQTSEISPYFHIPFDAFAGKLASDSLSADVNYTVDSSGRVYRLQDLNSDLDCDDPLEATIIANSLNGGFGIAVDPEGDVFVTGSDYVSGTHHLYEIKPGSPPTVTLFDDIASFAGWSGTIVFDTGSSFESQSTSANLYMNYSTLTWSDPNVFAVYHGSAPNVPSMSLTGIIILVFALAVLLRSNRAG